jgi:hypothetical protein
VPELPFVEQLNAPCYIHAYIDPKDGTKKSSQLLRDYGQFIEMQKFYEIGRGNRSSRNLHHRPHLSTKFSKFKLVILMSPFPHHVDR